MAKPDHPTCERERDGQWIDSTVREDWNRAAVVCASELTPVSDTLWSRQVRFVCKHFPLS